MLLLLPDYTTLILRTLIYVYTGVANIKESYEPDYGSSGPYFMQVIHSHVFMIPLCGSHDSNLTLILLVIPNIAYMIQFSNICYSS